MSRVALLMLLLVAGTAEAVEGRRAEGAKPPEQQATPASGDAAGSKKGGGKDAGKEEAASGGGAASTAQQGAAAAPACSPCCYACPVPAAAPCSCPCPAPATSPSTAAAEARALDWPEAALAGLFVLAVAGSVVAAGVMSTRGRASITELDQAMRKIREQDLSTFRELAARLERMLDEEPARVHREAEAARDWALRAAEALARGPSRDDLAIESVEPPSAPAADTTAITIRGRGFDPGSKVFVGGDQIVTGQVVSSREIRVEVPPRAPRTVPVSVMTPDGTVVMLARAFTYR
jgi:hypothetical protein